MKKGQVRMSEVFVAIITATPPPSWTMFSLLVSLQREKRELAVLTLTQEASKKAAGGGCERFHGSRLRRGVLAL
jgi:hypothetical protein